MYLQTDRYLKRLKKQIRTEFNHLSLLSFDELNTVRTRKETKDTFDHLMRFNEREYLKIVRQARKYALSLLTEQERKKVKEVSYNEWEDLCLEDVLASYNWVTGYLYRKEAERKRLRLAEEMMTAKEYHDRERYSKSLSKGANLWYTQSHQYAIDLEDETTQKVWKKGGVKKVRWIAEDDDKTCSDCRKLNGKIFDIDKVPHKTHYRCRCIVVPYRD